MQWNWWNVIFIVIGIVAIVGCSIMIKNRAAVQARVARENTGIYGRRLGPRIAERRASNGVVGPAVIGIVLGVACVLAGLLVHSS